jgi:diamine N-acetyltransferase
MILRPASADDLPYILDLESKNSRLGFVGCDTLAVHQERLSDPDCLCWIAEAEGHPAGYAILRGLLSANRSVELKRLVIADPGRGLGRQVLDALLAEVFHRRGAHRFWLDVFEHNRRALHVYRSVGFVQEGVIRECVRFGDRYDSLILMSMLESEYRLK